MADASESIISWNIPNWVSIILMAGIGFAALGFLQKWIVSRRNSSANS